MENKRSINNKNVKQLLENDCLLILVSPVESTIADVPYEKRKKCAEAPTKF